MGQLRIIQPSEQGHADETRLRLSITDVGTLRDPLIYRVQFTIGRRHSELRTVGETEWTGRDLDLLPSGASDVISAMLWGNPGDASRAVIDLGRARRRYRRE